MSALGTSRRVRCTSSCPLYPENDRESGFPHKVMSALPPKADMCGALAYVCFGPMRTSDATIELDILHACGEQVGSDGEG
jgi:hypothetical protein